MRELRPTYPHRLRSTHKRIMDEKRADPNYKSSEQQVSEELERMGKFYAHSEGESIYTHEAKDRYDEYKVILFSLNDPYKAFHKLGLKVFDYLGFYNSAAVYIVKDDGRWQLLEVTYTKEFIKIERIL